MLSNANSHISVFHFSVLAFLKSSGIERDAGAAFPFPQLSAFSGNDYFVGKVALTDIFDNWFLFDQAVTGFNSGKGFCRDLTHGLRPPRTESPFYLQTSNHARDPFGAGMAASLSFTSSQNFCHGSIRIGL